MATQYTRTYKFTGQSNTAAPRTVNWTKFSVSGDTDKTVAQIISITVTHYHTSTDSVTRTLRERLTLADGTTFVSNEDSHAIHGNVVKYTNTFSSLPTAEQFAQITKLETINESGANNQTGYTYKLYWRATKDYPIVVTVVFTDTPPTKYAPKVNSFIVGRCDASGNMADDGTYLKTTLKLSIGDSAGLTDNMSVKIYYKADGVPTTSDSSVDLTSRVSELISGVTLNSTILTGTWAQGSAWYFAVVFTTGDEQAVGADSVGNAFAPMFVSKDGKRVSVGGFPKKSSGSAFEVFPAAAFYGGVSQVGAGANVPAGLGVQSGTTDTVSVGNGSYKDVAVTFAQAYSAAPVVIVGFASGSTAGNFGRCCCAVLKNSTTGPTTTGFTLRIFNGDSTDREPRVAWVAVGQLS